MELKGRSAIVTGAGKGIGRSIAIDLAKEGVNTFLCSRNGEELNQTALICGEYGVASEFAVIDLSMIEAPEELVRKAIKCFGKVDILVNNAGMLISEDFFTVDGCRWEKIMAVNVKAPFFIAQSVLEDMKKHREGYIINISSTIAFGAKPESAVYSISKTALAAVSEVLFKTAKEFGVRVSTIYPGVTDTPLLRSLNIPSGPDQWMKPEDISSCVLFLLKTNERMVIKDLIPWSVKYDVI